MRVITGTARGVRLLTPEGDGVRPTTDKVKESIFNIIQFDVPASRVLDLFAGSGQLGIEALSREALSCVFCDASRKSLDLVKSNLERTRLTQNAVLRCSDYSLFLDTCKDSFDIIFLDPPYGTAVLQKAVNKAHRILSPYGLMVCEHGSDEQVAAPDDTYESKSYKYGKITLTVLRKREAE